MITALTQDAIVSARSPEDPQQCSERALQGPAFGRAACSNVAGSLRAATAAVAYASLTHPNRHVLSSELQDQP